MDAGCLFIKNVLIYAAKTTIETRLITSLQNERIALRRLLEFDTIASSGAHPEQRYSLPNPTVDMQ